MTTTLSLRSLSRLLLPSLRRGVFGHPCFTSASNPETPKENDAVKLPIHGSCILARAPLLRPLPEDWEIEYQMWSQQVREQREQNLPQEWQRKKKLIEDEEEEEDTQQNEGAEWQELDRITQADKEGDTKSLMRFLDRYLYFIVKTRSGGWSFPATLHNAGETIRKTGERALAECIGPRTDVFFIANWPIAHYTFKEGARARTEFYMKAQLLSGQATLLPNSDFVDHAWIAKSEMDGYIDNIKLRGLLNRALQ